MQYSIIAYIYSSVDGEPLGIKSNKSVRSVIGTGSDGARAWNIGWENRTDVFRVGGEGRAQVYSAFVIYYRKKKDKLINSKL